MNPLDWMLAILLTYSVVRAVMQGFFREAFALGGMVVGFLLACWYYRQLALHLAGLISSPPIAQFASFLILLAACMVVASLLGKALDKAARVAGLGFLNRLMGGLFGLIRGALLGTAVLTALTAFLPTSQWITNSQLAPYFLRAAHAVSFVMPADLKNRFHDGVEHLRHATPNWIPSPPAQQHTK
ncbi:MAG TPA: CvpA family protein [Acidobacteriaceae bacterium]|jgi:membrane protein required for colicin V production